MTTIPETPHLAATFGLTASVGLVGLSPEQQQAFGIDFPEAWMIVSPYGTILSEIYLGPPELTYTEALAQAEQTLKQTEEELANESASQI